MKKKNKSIEYLMQKLKKKQINGIFKHFLKADNNCNLPLIQTSLSSKENSNIFRAAVNDQKKSIIRIKSDNTEYSFNNTKYHTFIITGYL